MFEASLLHFHSVGRVSANKAFGSHEIKVFPVEHRFNTDENVVDKINVENLNFKTNEGDDAMGIAIGNSITARWLKFNSNRWTAPDVRRNDKVLIWRMGNSEQYYWTDMNEANVKRLETVMFVWSGDPKNPIADDLSNAYYLEISTHQKSITLVTSQANGEPYGYTIQLNTGEGHFVLQDTETNELLLDTAETLIRATNAAKTQFELNKKVINGYAPDTINFEAVNGFNIKCKDYTLDASNSITTKTKTHKGTASSGYDMTTPLAKWSANGEFGGNLSVANALDAASGSIKSISSDSASIKSISGGSASFPDGHGPH